MNTARDIERARRHQLWLSIIVTILIAALAGAVTWLMLLRSDLPVLIQVIVPAIFWSWVVWGVRELRKIYMRMGIAPENPHIDS